MQLYRLRDGAQHYRIVAATIHYPTDAVSDPVDGDWHAITGCERVTCVFPVGSDGRTEVLDLSVEEYDALIRPVQSRA
jgi:hypothetical protein